MYVMPQVGSWTRTAATGEKCTADDGSPNFSYVSLDRSGADHRWNADAAYNLPDSNIQGATRFNDRWYPSRSRGITNNGTFYTTRPITSATGTLSIASDKPISKGPEDLSHWPGGTPTAPTLGEMWTVAEHPGAAEDGSGQGQRMLYAWAP
ncbi:hypothetical protein AB0L25_17440 [Spirillospora sp. NPDC052242]